MTTNDFKQWMAKAVTGDFSDDNDNGQFANHHHDHEKHRNHQWYFLTTGDAENSPLHDALIAGDDALAKQLIDNGADVNAKNQAGVTPLHLATNDGCKGMTKLLLERGANAQATDNDGKNPEAYIAESTGAVSDSHQITRRRRQVRVEGPVMRRLAGSSHLANNQPQIAGQADGVADTYMPNSGAISDATMLIELAMRKLTGAKYESSSRVSETKDQYMAGKVDAIEGRLSSALKNFSGASSS